MRQQLYLIFFFTSFGLLLPSGIFADIIVVYLIYRIYELHYEALLCKFVQDCSGELFWLHELCLELRFWNETHSCRLRGLYPHWTEPECNPIYAELLCADPLTSFYFPLGLSASSPNGSYDTAGSCRCGVAPPRSLSQRSVAACFASLCHAGNARLPHPGQSQSSW